MTSTSCRIWMVTYAREFAREEVADEIGEQKGQKPVRVGNGAANHLQLVRGFVFWNDCED